MSTTMDRSTVQTVDLRDPEFSIPSPVDSVEEAPRDHRAALRRRRRALMATTGALAVMLVLHVLVGTLMAAQRQRHLAYDLTVPDSEIAPGEASMVLQAPSIGMNVVVAEGASSQELRGGPGRVIGTADLVDAGNVVVLGRRSRFGAAFARIGELAKGDSIVARSRGGVVRSYTVESVSAAPSSSARPLQSNDDQLTLVTSGSGLLPSGRLVVVARAVAPPPTATGTDGAPEATAPPVTATVGVEALDERSTGVIGLGLGAILLAAAALGGVLAVRKLRVSYRMSTIVQIIIPMAALLMIVMFIVGDSVLPATY